MLTHHNEHSKYVSLILLLQKNPRLGLEKHTQELPSSTLTAQTRTPAPRFSPPAPAPSARPRPLICVGRAPQRPAPRFLQSSASPAAQTRLGAGPGRSTCPFRPHDGGGRGLSRGAPPRVAGAGVCGRGTLRGLPRFFTSPVGARRTRTQAQLRACHPTRPRLASRSTGKAEPISERRFPSDSRPPTRCSHPGLPVR